MYPKIDLPKFSYTKREMQNRMKRISSLPVCLGLAAALVACGVSAQPTVSSSPFQTTTSAGKSPLTLAQSGAVEVYLMVEQLQQEVRELRGMVEQQAYTIEQLKAQQRDRYMDLDQRLLNLDRRLSQNGTPAGGAMPPATAGAATAAEPPVAASTAGAEIAASKEPVTDAQKKAYEQAYELIRQRQFDKAVDALHAFINQYPNTDLTANAYYWLGEVYLVMPKLEQAKQAFTVVVSRYPKHRKASDAYYKLGVTLDRLGESAQARTYLRGTAEKYPGSAAAGLAQDYLKKLP